MKKENDRKKAGPLTPYPTKGMGGTKPREEQTKDSDSGPLQKMGGPEATKKGQEGGGHPAT
eukprot:14682172-Heterocapsa_arctica.AAC.1